MIKEQKRNPLPSLYAQLGTSYFLKSTKTSKTKSLPYSTIKLAYKQKSIPREKARKEGRRQYQSLQNRIKKLVCVKLKWCKQSEKISKSKTPLTYAVLSSSVIAHYIPEWAVSGGVLAIFLKLNKDFDKMCQCRKKS